jgi:hypothetical protein
MRARIKTKSIKMELFVVGEMVRFEKDGDQIRGKIIKFCDTDKWMDALIFTADNWYLVDTLSLRKVY